MKFNILKVPCLLLSVFFIGSCSSPRGFYQKDFEILPEGKQIKKGTIAILPGMNNDANFLLIKRLIGDLSKKSSFEVVSFDKVYSVVKEKGNLIKKEAPLMSGGGVTMSRVTSVSRETKEGASWISNENKQRILSAQKTLGTKYLYVVWIDHLYELSGGGKFTGVYIDGRLLEYPQNEVVGFTYESYNQKHDFLDFSKSKAQYVEQLLNKVSGELTDKIVEVTGLKK